jgi:hypothetical protein
MILLPMPTYTASKNNDPRLRLPSDCRHRGPKFWVLAEDDAGCIRNDHAMSLGAIGLTDSL